jgi:prepilin-type N-terminal cleavage/methylation domain-containing protein
MRRTPAAGRTRRAGGFTLLELMIAMSVIAVALFGILAMITQMVAMREVNRESEIAKEWVQQEIEKVKSYPFTSLNTAGTYAANTSGPSGAAYTGTTAMALHPAPALANASGTVLVNYANPNLYEIVVTLNWKGRKGSGTYTMRSLISK